MNRHNLLYSMILSLILIAFPGCTATVRPGGGSDAGADGTDHPPVDPPADATTVVVQLVNETTVVVETQFYAAANLTNPSPADLFVPENLMTNGVGVASTGLLIPRTADDVEIPCTQNLVLGVAGGRFLDPDLGTEIGQGTRRIVPAGWVFDCGAVIVFTYKGESIGYSVDVNLE